MKLKKTSILDGAEIKAVTHLMRAAIPGLAEIVDTTCVELETVARMMSLAARVTEAREKLGLTIKEAARQLEVPQYRIKDIEAGTAQRIDPEVMRRYLVLLGLGRWAKRWAAANGELAERLGLVATASAPKQTPGKKALPRKKAVPKKRKAVASKQKGGGPAKRASTKPKSDLDIDHEMYLEAYAEDDDGGKRPKLSKAKFAELSDEMMDLVTWENVGPLPAAKQRRMKELEYLLIG